MVSLLFGEGCEVKQILVVDDQANIRMMLRMALREYFEIDEAQTGEQAYAMIIQRRPDAIVLDVMMPGEVDGFQLCESIKKNSALKSIHVVLVTARGQVSDQELGRAVGANAYFVKPFSPRALRDHLRGALLVS